MRTRPDPPLRTARLPQDRLNVPRPSCRKTVERRIMDMSGMQDFEMPAEGIVGPRRWDAGRADAPRILRNCCEGSAGTSQRDARNLPVKTQPQS